jgi:uncharacterized membrane protein YkoI
MYPLRKIVAAGAIAGVGLLGVAIGATTLGRASAATDPTPSTSVPASTSSNSTDTSGTADAKGPHEANGITETGLTGDDLAKATAAAQAAVPDATIDRVETDADGATYEAHMTNSDGTKVTVKMDANFTVTATEAGEAGGGGRHGGGGGHQRDGETELTGDDLAKATAAAQAAIPDGTVERAETDADGAAYEVHMTKADGSDVTVKLDANFAVTSTVDGKG